MTKTERTKVRRVPKRGHYDRETIYNVLDKNFTCHIGFIYNDYPVVIPTIYGRSGDRVFFHGASVSRMITTLEMGVPVCLSIHTVQGIVLARSAFHHSVNYESVVLFGKASLVEENNEKMRALKVISDHIVPGRWEEIREPNGQEMKGTKVLGMNIDESSAKIRTGPPVDDEEDYDLDIWAGVLPITTSFGSPVPDPRLKNGLSVPQSVHNLVNRV